MAAMQAVYYRAPDGSEPVDAFVEALRDPDKQAALDNQIERLNMLRPNDPPLPFPWSSQIEGELRELRCHYGSELYRVIYRRSGNLFVLLHMFRKDSGKVPEAELRLARQHGRTSKARMDAERRRPPRAAGLHAGAASNRCVYVSRVMLVRACPRMRLTWTTSRRMSMIRWLAKV
jgi:phage-related protein